MVQRATVSRGEAGGTAGWGRLVEGLGQRRALGWRAQAPAARVAMAPVAQPGGALLVVALRERADPLAGVAGDGRHRLRGLSWGELPAPLSGASGGRLSGAPRARGQFLRAQVQRDPRSFGHTSSIHQDLV